MNKNTADKNLELGKYDEAELIELVEADVYGGTWSVVASVTATITAASEMGLCPTGACTDSC